jgi:hypothetical protein
MDGELPRRENLPKIFDELDHADGHHGAAEWASVGG